MIKSGSRNAICADRPSVNNSNLRISFRTLAAAAGPSSLRKWWVTMSERGAGSSSGFESSTRTARPPRASFAAVYNPAADPPTTIISCFSRLEREVSFGSPTLLSLSRNCLVNLPTRPLRASFRHDKKPARIARAQVGAGNRTVSQYSESSALGKRLGGENPDEREAAVRAYVAVAAFFACLSYA